MLYEIHIWQIGRRSLSKTSSFPMGDLRSADLDQLRMCQLCMWPFSSWQLEFGIQVQATQFLWVLTLTHPVCLVRFLETICTFPWRTLPLVLGGWHEDSTIVSTSSTLSERLSLTPTVLLPKISDQLLVPALGYEGWGVLSREVSLWLSERLVFYLSVCLEQLSSPDNLAKSPLPVMEGIGLVRSEPALEPGSPGF